MENGKNPLFGKWGVYKVHGFGKGYNGKFSKKIGTTLKNRHYLITAPLYTKLFKRLTQCRRFDHFNLSAARDIKSGFACNFVHT